MDSQGCVLLMSIPECATVRPIFLMKAALAMVSYRNPYFVAAVPEKLLLESAATALAGPIFSPLGLA